MSDQHQDEDEDQERDDPGSGDRFPRTHTGQRVKPSSEDEDQYDHAELGAPTGGALPLRRPHRPPVMWEPFSCGPCPSR